MFTQSIMRTLIRTLMSHRGSNRGNNRVSDRNTSRDAGPSEHSLPVPSYVVTDIIEEGCSGWQVEITNTSSVVYRIVSGFEQTVEKETDFLYLSVMARGCRCIGFRFKCLRPYVEHTKDRKNNSFRIRLFILR